MPAGAVRFASIAVASLACVSCLCTAESTGGDETRSSQPKQGKEFLIGSWKGVSAQSTKTGETIPLFDAIAKAARIDFDDEQIIFTLGEGDAHVQRHEYEIVEVRPKLIRLKTMHRGKPRMQRIEIVDDATIRMSKEGEAAVATLKRRR